jgi:hypothetical protein
MAPEPRSPEAAPSPQRETPSRQGLARELASMVGNAAFARHVAGGTLLRQTEDAATAATAAPSGPLKKLRDELDDTFVDEDDCLTWIGQLGEGERGLVGKDETMMKQIAEAFDIDEVRGLACLGARGPVSSLATGVSGRGISTSAMATTVVRWAM